MIEATSVPDEAGGDKPGACRTPTSARIESLLSVCHQYRLIGVLVGESGSGKTTTGEGYAKLHPGVCYCRMRPAAAKTRWGLAEVAAALGIHGIHRTNEHEASLTIGADLDYPGSECLILDEMQYAGDELLEYIRGFWDTCRIGVVMIGNPTLTDRWSGQRAGRQSFDQLRGRIGPQAILRGPSLDDVTAIARHHGVTDDGATNVLWEASLLPGGLHNVAQVLQVARAIHAEGPLSEDSLRKAALLTGVSE